MSTFDRVKNASSPQDALLALAHALDAIQGEIVALREQPPSSDGWDAWESRGESQEDEWTPDPSVLRRLDELEDELAENSDPAEVRALETERRLLKEQLKPPVVHDEGVGTRAKVSEGKDGLIVELPPASEEKQLGRRQFAESVLDFATALGPEHAEEYTEAYVKGGPLWLYYGNRDLVMGLTDDVKQIMVADVLEDSPQEALEMGRDILKDPDPGALSFAAATYGNVE